MHSNAFFHTFRLSYYYLEVHTNQWNSVTSSFASFVLLILLNNIFTTNRHFSGEEADVNMQSGTTASGPWYSVHCPAAVQCSWRLSVKPPRWFAFDYFIRGPFGFTNTHQLLNIAVFKGPRAAHTAPPAPGRGAAIKPAEWWGPCPQRMGSEWEHPREEPTRVRGQVMPGFWGESCLRYFG